MVTSNLRQYLNGETQTFFLRQTCRRHYYPSSPFSQHQASLVNAGISGMVGATTGAEITGRPWTVGVRLLLWFEREIRKLAHRCNWLLFDCWEIPGQLHAVALAAVGDTRFRNEDQRIVVGFFCSFLFVALLCMRKDRIDVHMDRRELDEIGLLVLPRSDEANLLAVRRDGRVRICRLLRVFEDAVDLVTVAACLRGEMLLLLSWAISSVSNDNPILFVVFSTSFFGGIGEAKLSSPSFSFR